MLDVLFFKQKTAYEMRISDWSSDVCSSDLLIYSKPARCFQKRTMEFASCRCTRGLANWINKWSPVFWITISYRTLQRTRVACVGINGISITGLKSIHIFQIVIQALAQPSHQNGRES